MEGDCTLSDAITAANTDTATGGCTAGSGADEIRLTEDVTLTELDNETDGPNGLPAVTSEMTLEGGDFTIERDPLAEEFRIFRVAPSGVLTLSSTTVSGGKVGNVHGGAIYSRGSLTLIDSGVEDSLTLWKGGAIRSQGTLTLTNSTISDNYAGFRGCDFIGRCRACRLAPDRAGILVAHSGPAILSPALPGKKRLVYRKNAR